MGDKSIDEGVLLVSGSLSMGLVTHFRTAQIASNSYVAVFTQPLRQEIWQPWTREVC
jgi:hypothetical protein